MRHERAPVESVRHRMGINNRISGQLPDPIIRVGLLLTLCYWLVQTVYDAFVRHHGSFLDMLIPEDPAILHPRLFAFIALLIVTHYANKIATRPRPLLPGDARNEQEEVAFLSKTAMEFVDLPLEEDIYPHIGERIKELVGDGVVIINSFDEETDSLRVRCILGAGPLIEAAVRALGRHPVGLSFKMTEHARQGIPQGVLEKAEGGLYEACFGKINADLCHRLEYLAGVDEVYGVGFARRGGIFGDALIITRKDRNISSAPNAQEMVLHQGCME